MRFNVGVVDVVYLVADGGQSRDWLLPVILVVASAAAIGTAAAIQLRDRWHERQARLLRSARRELESRSEALGRANVWAESGHPMSPDAAKEEAGELAKLLAETNARLDRHHRALRWADRNPKRREWMFFGLGVIASIGVSLVFWLLGPPP
jgi:hypothetical protein